MTSKRWVVRGGISREAARESSARRAREPGRRGNGSGPIGTGTGTGIAGGDALVRLGDILLGSCVIGLLVRLVVRNGIFGECLSAGEHERAIESGSSSVLHAGEELPHLAAKGHGHAAVHERLELELAARRVGTRTSGRATLEDGLHGVEGVSAPNVGGRGRGRRGCAGGFRGGDAAVLAAGQERVPSVRALRLLVDVQRCVRAILADVLGLDLRREREGR